MSRGGLFGRVLKGGLFRRGSETADVDRLDALTEVTRRRVIINASSNYSRYGVSLLVNLFLQAYIIRSLGAAEYSIWPLVITITGFITLVPIAISGGVSRYLANAFTRKDLPEVERIATSVFVATLLGTVVYVGAVVAFSVSFEKIFSIPEGAAGIGPWVMLLVGLGEASKVPVSVYQGGLDAAQKFIALNTREIGILLLYGTMVVVGFTTSGPALIWVGAVYALAQALGAVFTWRVARRILPWLRVRRGAFSWSVMRPVLSFGVWVLTAAVATLLYWRTGSIIINKLLDPVLVTGYSVVISILTQGYALAGFGTGVLYAAASVLQAKGDHDRLSRMVYRASRVTTAMAGPVLLFMAFFGRPIMTIYLDDPAYGDFGIYFAVLGAAMIVQMTQLSGRTVPGAFAKNAAFAIVSMLCAAVNVGLAIFAVQVLDAGLMGVAASAAIIITLFDAIFSPWYCSRLLEVSWWSYFVRSLALPIVHCLPALAVLAAFYLAGLGDTLVQLIAIAAVVAAVHGIYMLKFGLMPEDRKAVLGTVTKLARRRHERG